MIRLCATLLGASISIVFAFAGLGCDAGQSAQPVSASQIYERYVREIQAGIPIGETSEVRATGYDTATGELTGIAMTRNGMPASAERMQVLIDAEADTIRFVLIDVVLTDEESGVRQVARLETEPLALGVDVQAN
ncbi:MAG: hypothetical protein AAGI30_01525 [Planctomycetota bacterium]